MPRAIALAAAGLLIAGPAAALTLDAPNTVTGADFGIVFDGPLATPTTVNSVTFDGGSALAPLFGFAGPPARVCGFFGGAGCQGPVVIDLPAPSRDLSVTISGTPAQARAYDGAELVAIRSNMVDGVLDFGGGYNIDRVEIEPTATGPGNSVAFEGITFTPQSLRDPRTFVDFSLAPSDTFGTGEEIRGVRFDWFGGFAATRDGEPPDLCAFAPGAGCLGATTATLPAPSSQVSYDVTGNAPTQHEAFDAMGARLAILTLGSGGGRVDFGAIGGIASVVAAPSRIDLGANYFISELSFQAPPPSGEVPLPGAAPLLALGAAALAKAAKSRARREV
ncbi:MAG: hypothetical protein AAF676_00395 [Pseudomonadota bacterium]